MPVCVLMGSVAAAWASFILHARASLRCLASSRGFAVLMLLLLAMLACVMASTSGSLLRPPGFARMLTLTGLLPCLYAQAVEVVKTATVGAASTLLGLSCIDCFGRCFRVGLSC